MESNLNNKDEINIEFNNIINLLQNILNDVNRNKSKENILALLNCSLNNMKYLKDKVIKEIQQSSENSAAPPLINNSNVTQIITLNTDDGKYIGEVKNGVPNGRGKLIYTGKYEGDIYEGDFKNGLPDGKGKYIHKNGNIYEGDMVKDRADGMGIFYSNNGNRYEGEYKKDAREGKGIIYFPNGDRMMGDYQNNNPIGKHVILHSNGNVSQKIFN